MEVRGTRAGPPPYVPAGIVQGVVEAPGQRALAVSGSGFREFGLSPEQSTHQGRKHGFQAEEWLV